MGDLRPILKVNGKDKWQQSGTTLKDIRISYPACFLEEKESDEKIAGFHSDSFVLQDGHSYVLENSAGKPYTKYIYLHFHRNKLILIYLHHFTLRIHP
jgi:hypothetical protein